MSVFVCFIVESLLLVSKVFETSSISMVDDSVKMVGALKSGAHREETKETKFGREAGSWDITFFTIASKPSMYKMKREIPSGP